MKLLKLYLISPSPCSGKVNARNKITGEKRQISKEVFDTNKDIWAVVSYGVFEIKNRLTNEVKRVTIWDNLNSYKDEWESLSKKHKM